MSSEVAPRKAWSMWKVEPLFIASVNAWNLFACYLVIARSFLELCHASVEKLRYNIEISFIAGIEHCFNNI